MLILDKKNNLSFDSKISSKYYKLQRVNNIQLIGLFAMFIVILILISLMLNTDKYEQESIYSFHGEGDIFSFDNGLLIISRDNRYIDISNFKVKDDVDIKSLTINIAFNESIWAVKDYDDEDISLKQWLNNLRISEYGIKGELFGLKKADSFVKYNNIFPKDFKVEINYCTKDTCTVEILDIEASKLNPDNELHK